MDFWITAAPAVTAALLVAFKAVVLEGLEVVFIVIAVGAGRGLLWADSLGALAALWRGAGMQRLACAAHQIVGTALQR